jgi:hypothetical protein
MNTNHFPVRVAVTIGIISLTLTLLAIPAVAEKSSTSDNNQATTSGKVDQSGPNPSSDKGDTEDLKHTQDRIEAVKEAIASKAASLKLRIEDHQKIKGARLADNQLKSCQSRQAGITKHADTTAKSATSLEAKFTAIATKVEAFKTNKGISVPNYDSALAALTVKKTAVDTAVATANSTIVNFSCSSNGPKAQLQLFVSQMDTARQALKEYRTAIKALIQSVKQANGGNRQSTPSATPEGGV